MVYPSIRHFDRHLELFRPGGIFLNSFFILICLMLLLAGPVRSEPVVKMALKTTGTGEKGFRFTAIGVDAMQPHALKFKTLDSNFEEDGITEFTGIRLSRLAELAGGSPGQPLTIIGADQYVGYLPGKLLDKGMLVWEINGRAIRGLKGGPLKVVFPQEAGVHSACYTWYVEAMVAGSGADASLTLVHRDTVRHYARSELDSLAVPLDPSLFSIAQGCRNAFPSRSAAKQIMAVPLDRLLPERTGKTGGAPVSVTLAPFAGPGVTLPQDILDFPVYVVISCDGQPLHPALGGPFSVVFPLETHPELTGRVPESGALFFLEKVIVN